MLVGNLVIWCGLTNIHVDFGYATRTLNWLCTAPKPDVLLRNACMACSETALGGSHVVDFVEDMAKSLRFLDMHEVSECAMKSRGFGGLGGLDAVLGVIVLVFVLKFIEKIIDAEGR